MKKSFFFGKDCLKNLENIFTDAVSMSLKPSYYQSQAIVVQSPDNFVGQLKDDFKSQ